MENPLEGVLESERLAPMLPLLYSAWLTPGRPSSDSGWPDRSMTTRKPVDSVQTP